MLCVCLLVYLQGLNSWEVISSSYPRVPYHSVPPLLIWRGYSDRLSLGRDIFSLSISYIIHNVYIKADTTASKRSSGLNWNSWSLDIQVSIDIHIHSCNLSLVSFEIDEQILTWIKFNSLIPINIGVSLSRHSLIP